MAGDVMDELRAALADRYAIERELGRGGMSVVYMAHDRKHDRRVALKFLRPELTEAVGRGRFLREIRIAAALQHPAILPLFDSGEAAGRLYYVMPYVEGESLRARLLREIQIPLTEALQIAREVAEGLGHAHAQGIVHRDIKPENILLTGGHAVIADFGIARAVTAAAEDRLTEAGLAVGTPAYMSPEQAAGEAQIDGRSDLWSLGCVLYEMLAGETPFTGPSGHAILARVLHDQLPSLRVVRPTVAPPVEQAVERALAKVPADRFRTASEFIAALTAAPSGVVPRRRRAVRVGVAAAVGILLLAVAGLAVLWRLDGSGSVTAAAPDPTRIAVLYFEDRSEAGSLRHVARGLTENLIDELSGIGALRVISPGGVRPYSTGTWPLDSIVAALSVGSVVEGSVERVRDSLRVRVRLIDGATREQLQSEVIGRPWGDLFALQRDLAEEVSRFLRTRLGSEVRLRERRAATRSVAAWELLQRGEQAVEDARRLERGGFLHGASGLLRQADSLFARAAALDPEWTEPVVQRGWVAEGQARLVEAATTGVGGAEAARAPALALPETTWARRALGHADRALGSRSDDPRALHLRGFVTLRLWTMRGSAPEQATLLLADAERDLRRAVAVAPGFAGAWNALGLLLYQRGEFPEAALVLERALEADAYLSEAAANMQLLLFAALERGDAGAASMWCERGRARFPGDPRFAECDLIVLGWTGATSAAAARAWRALREIEARDSAALLSDTWAFRRMMVAAVLARARMTDSAARVVATTRASAPRASLLRGIELYEAYVFTLLGERERAIRSLDAFLRATPGHRAYVASTRWFEPLRGDARFRRLVAGDAPSPRAAPESR
jgi:serine/threonine-protein kinase